MNYAVKLHNLELIEEFREKTKKHKLKQTDLIEQYMLSVIQTLNLYDELEKAGKRIPLNILDLEFKFNLEPFIEADKFLRSKNVK